MPSPTGSCRRVAEARSMGPSYAEWEAHRGAITSMFIERNMSLSKVQDRMLAEHNFRASCKMYKARFHQWGLKKKMTKERARAGLIQLRNQGFKPASKAQFVEWRKIMAYLDRLPTEEQEKILMTAAQASRASSSSLIPGDEPSGVSVPSLLTTPGDLKALEDCLGLLQIYVKGSAESHYWPRDPVNGFKNEDIVPTWCSPLMSAAWILGEGKVKEASVLLGAFMNQSPYQLQRQDPLLFSFIFTSILFFAKTHPGTASKLLDGFVVAAGTLPWRDSTHPLPLVLRSLRQLEPALIYANASRILPAYVTMIQEALGTTSPIVQDMMSDALSRLLTEGLLEPQAVTDVGLRMAATAVSENQHHNSYHLNLQWTIAFSHLKSDRFAEAREIAEDLIADHNADIRKENIVVDVDMILSKINEKQGKHDEAIYFANKAVTDSKRLFGENSDWALNSIIFYKKTLERLGKTDQMSGVVRNRDGTLRELVKNHDRRHEQEQEVM